MFSPSSLFTNPLSKMLLFQVFSSMVSGQLAGKKQAIIWTRRVFQTFNLSCRGSSFKICNWECLCIFLIFSCFSCFLIFSMTHTFTYTYTPTFECWRTSCALSSLTFSFNHKFTHTTFSRAKLLYFLYFSLIFLLMTAKACKVKDDLSGNN